MIELKFYENRNTRNPLNSGINKAGIKNLNNFFKGVNKGENSRLSNTESAKVSAKNKGNVNGATGTSKSVTSTGSNHSIAISKPASPISNHKREIAIGSNRSKNFNNDNDISEISETNIDNNKNRETSIQSTATSNQSTATSNQSIETNNPSTETTSEASDLSETELLESANNREEPNLNDESTITPSSSSTNSSLMGGRRQGCASIRNSTKYQKKQKK